jgi:hypothetical protein
MARIPLLLLGKLRAQRFLPDSARGLRHPGRTHDRLGGNLKVAVQRGHVELVEQ